MITHEQVARNSLYVSLAFAFNFIAAIVSSVLLTHLLGRDGFGRYGYYTRIFAWVSTISILTVPPILRRYVAELRGQQKMTTAWVLFRHAVRLHFAIICVVLPVSLLILVKYKTNESYYYAAIFAVGLAYISYVLSFMVQSYLEGCQAFGFISLAGIAGTLARIIGLALLFVGGFKTVVAALAILAVEQLILLLCICIGVRKFCYHDVPASAEPISKSFRQRLIDYGVSMTLAGLFSMVSWNYIEVFFIKHFWVGESSVDAELGYYCLAISLASLPIRILMGVSRTLHTAFAHMYGSGDHDRISRWYQSATVISTLLGAFVCISAFAVAKPVLILLFPDDLLPVILPFRILLIPAFALSVSYPTGAVVPAIGGHRFMVIACFGAAIINLALDIFLIPNYGATGAAMVNAIVQTLLCFIGIWYASIYRGFGFPFYRVLRICFCLIVSGSAGWLVCAFVTFNNMASLLLGLLSVFICYLFLIRQLKVIGKEEKKILETFVNMLPAWLSRCIIKKI